MQSVLSDFVAELPPELTGALTFHLPMELLALGDAGASQSTLDRRTEVRLSEAYAAGLIDPPLYRWAVERYARAGEAALSSNAEHRRLVIAEIEPLADGLAGAAFHGLIRVGYGAWHRDAKELARGFAYLRTRRQVLSVGLCGPVSGQHDFPTPDRVAGATVFDQLNLAAGTGACLQSTSGVTVRSLAVAATNLVERNPSSFVAVHALTSFHALCELHNLLLGEPPADESITSPLSAWWKSFSIAVQACSIVVSSYAPEALAAYDGSLGPAHTIDEVVQASLRSDETHDVKVAVALRRLVAFGVLNEDEAVNVGGARLAAGQIL